MIEVDDKYLENLIDILEGKKNELSKECIKALLCQGRLLIHREREKLRRRALKLDDYSTKAIDNNH